MKLTNKQILELIDEKLNSVGKQIVKVQNSDHSNAVLQELYGQRNALIELQSEIDFREKKLKVALGTRDNILGKPSEWNKYWVEHKGFICVAVRWDYENGNRFLLTSSDNLNKVYVYIEKDRKSLVSDTDYIRCAIEEFLNSDECKK